jgi:hypothetical protein
MYYQAFKNDQIQRQQDLKEQKLIVDTDTKMGQALSPRGPAGAALKIENAGQRLLDMVNDPDVIKNGMTQAQMRLAAADLTSMYNNGTGTEGGAQALIDNNTATLMAKGSAFLNSEPTPIAAKGYTDQFRKLAQTVVTLAQKNQLAMLNPILSAASKFAQDPSHLESVRQQRIQPILDRMKNTQQSSGVAPPHPEDSAAVTWAKNNPSDPRAQKILQLNK